MGEIRKARPVKLFVAALAVETTWLDRAETRLQERFGPVDLRSPVAPFRSTEYYSREMGPSLCRQLFSFERPFDTLGLAAAKEWTNALEDEFREGGRRRANLDPGYLNEAKIVLASTKENAHRIPIGPGIHAEITMLYESKTESYTPLRWTYPDFASGDYADFFAAMRRRFRGHNT